MSLSNSQLFSVNILSALEADDLDNPDPEDTEFCQLIWSGDFHKKSPNLKVICKYVILFFILFCAIPAQAITLTNLKYLTESDLADLFKNDTIGARAEFRHQLITWRKANVSIVKPPLNISWKS